MQSPIFWHQLLQHFVDLGRRRFACVERRGGVVEGDRLAVVPELAGAEVAVPLDIEPTGAVQYDFLGRGKFQFLARWQNMIKGDIGVKGELLGGADISAHFFEQPIDLLRDRRRCSARRGCWSACSSRSILRRSCGGQQHPGSKCAEPHPSEMSLLHLLPPVVEPLGGAVIRPSQGICFRCPR